MTTTNSAERINYIEAAIMNNKQMYNEIETEAYYAKAENYSRKQFANFCNDFITLYKKDIADAFPWLNPMNDEIIEVLSVILDEWEYEATNDDISEAVDWAREKYEPTFNEFYTPEKCACSRVFVDYVRDDISRRLFDRNCWYTDEQLNEAVKLFFERCKTLA